MCISVSSLWSSMPREQLIKQEGEKRRITFQFALCACREWKAESGRWKGGVRYFIWLGIPWPPCPPPTHTPLPSPPSLKGNPVFSPWPLRSTVRMCVCVWVYMCLHMRSVFTFRILVINTGQVQGLNNSKGKPTPRARVSHLLQSGPTWVHRCWKSPPAPICACLQHNIVFHAGLSVSCSHNIKVAWWCSHPCKEIKLRGRTQLSVVSPGSTFSEKDQGEINHLQVKSAFF